jgi:Cenp-O kinetochore centromere component
LVIYHKRVAIIDSLRTALSSSEEGTKVEMGAEARDIRITWTEGRVARVKVGELGRIERCVVLAVSEEGKRIRDRTVEGLICADGGRMEGLAGRLVGL